MGVRDQMNKHPSLTVGTISATVVAVLALTVYQLMASRPKFPVKSPDSYFTTDDGKTFFTASADNVPPFDQQGQTAVRAYVFQSGGKKFVGYVERFSSDARQLILTKKATPATYMYGRELKRPGDRTWIKSGDVDGLAKITDVHGPDGSPAEPIEP